MPLNSDLHSETQRLPRIGEKAPFFKGQSTQGEITLDDFVCQNKLDSLPTSM